MSDKWIRIQRDEVRARNRERREDAGRQVEARAQARRAQRGNS